MAALGDRLKEARLKQGLSLKEIAEKTRIQVHFLEALEGNNPEVIPGAFFRKSFLRQYASFLGLNPEEFRLDDALQFGSFGGSEDAVSTSPAIHVPLDLPPLPTPGRTREFPLRQISLSIGLLVGVVAVCAVAYTFWEDFQNSRTTPPTESVERQSGQDSPQSAAVPAVPDSNKPGDSASEPASGAPASETPPAASGAEADPTSVASDNKPQEDIRVAQAAPEEPNEPETTVHGSGPRELRLSAEALTWVRVREGDRTLFIGTIDAGQTRVVRVTEQAQILTGNAGSLRILWQGKDLGTIGPVGQIRTVLVTPNDSSIQAPAPKSPPSTSGDQSNSSREG